MRDLALLMLPRLLGLRNAILGSGGRVGRRLWVMGPLAVAFTLGLFWLTCHVLGYFQSIEVIGDLLAGQLLSMVLLTFFAMLLLSNLITGLSTLYLSKDLEFCHALPVTVEALFLSRGLQAIVDSSWMLILFALPVFGAYARVYAPQPAFYLHLLHGTLALVMIAGALGLLAALLLVHLLPARRARDILALLSLLLVAGLYLLFRMLRPERLVNPDAFFSVVQYLGALKAPSSPYLPTTWMKTLLWRELAGQGDPFPWLEAALMWSTAVALGVIAVEMSARVYAEGYSRSQEAPRRRSGAGWLLEQVSRMPGWVFGRDQAAVLAKDIKLFFRDSTQWSQLLLLGALVVVYLYNFSVLPLDMSPVRADFLQNELAFFNLGLAAFVVSAISVRFVFPSVSLEGEAFWILRSSPLSLRRYLWSKCFFFLLPVAVMGEGLVLATNLILEVTPLIMALCLATMPWLVWGVVALATGLGAANPQFRYEHAARLSTGYGALLYMLASGLYIAVVVGLEAWPVYLLFMADARGRALTAGEWSMIVGFLAGVPILSLVLGLRAMRTGLNSLESYEL